MTLSSFKLQHLKNTILSLLETTKPISQLHQIHTRLITNNLFSDLFIASRFLCSITPNTTYAELVFTQIDQPNTFIYNTMVKSYISSSNPNRALDLYIKMRRNGLSGDNYTYPIVLKACGMICGVWEGKEVHGEVVKGGFELDLYVRNGLICMYSRCGEMGSAKALFGGFCGKDLVTWNLMIAGHVGCGNIVEAQKLFDQMPERDVFTWTIMVDGYGKKNGDVVRAREFFDSMPMKDLVSWNSMIDGYAKVGEMVAARQLFDQMGDKNVISWSIMIDGYARQGNPKEALDLFGLMFGRGLKPDNVSVVGALMACAQLGALDQGRWIHTYMKKNKIISDIVVQTALIDMYMKCGSVNEACKTFNSMPERNVVTWNVMISGLGMNGFEEKSLQFFDQMEREKIQMDDLIFLSVLTSCSHAGLVPKGLEIFERMRKNRIEPKLEHYGCLIDLLGQAGQLGKAQKVIDTMCIKPNSALWGSLLMACRSHREVALAESVVERLVELKVDDSGVYVLMSNIYADAGMWDGTMRMRKVMREKNVSKEIGRSVIEVTGSVEEFISGKDVNIRSKDIELVLRSLMKMEMVAE